MEAGGTRKRPQTKPVTATAISVAIVMATLWTLWGGGSRPAFAQTCLLPSATVKVWDTQPLLGFNPTSSIDDPSNLSGHSGVTTVPSAVPVGTAVSTASGPTIVTAYDNTTNPCGPCGVSFWNPSTNSFLDYGRTGGFQTGVAINKSGPVQTGGPGGTSFGPGDVWLAGQTGDRIWMVVHGSNNLRGYGADSSLNGTWGVRVDPATGFVFFTEPGFGGSATNIVRLNPVTNTVVRWSVGSQPAYITLDSSGRPYATLSGSNQIVRVDPGPDGVLGTADDTATFWTVPTPAAFVPVASAGSSLPDGITTDANGRIWFNESNVAVNKVGRLDPVASPNTICEYTKPGMFDLQQIASTGSISGSTDTTQTFFSEATSGGGSIGRSLSIVTQVEADMPLDLERVCFTVAPTTVPVAPTTATVGFTDTVCTPRAFVITPETFTVAGLDGFESGTTTTSTGECIPAILRFSPLPTASTCTFGCTDPHPSAITGVYASNRVSGAHLFANEHFEVQSSAIIAPPPAPPSAPGRMTGGGSVFTTAGVRVTHGFELHCDATQGPNNLEVNFGKGNNFHLTSLTSASCTDDPTISPNPPPAGFDTYTGSGTGTCNGAAATATWTFTDAGEPGTNDTAKITITGGCSLSVSGKLRNGNQQAHAQ